MQTMDTNSSQIRCYIVADKNILIKNYLHKNPSNASNWRLLPRPNEAYMLLFYVTEIKNTTFDAWNF